MFVFAAPADHGSVYRSGGCHDQLDRLDAARMVAVLVGLSADGRQIQQLLRLLRVPPAPRRRSPRLVTPTNALPETAELQP
jgi:hypothetical protein